MAVEVGGMRLAELRDRAAAGRSITIFGAFVRPDLANMETLKTSMHSSSCQTER